eukprot:1159534-Pelagomonas_calceolata.AAC.1
MAQELAGQLGYNCTMRKGGFIAVPAYEGSFVEAKKVLVTKPDRSREQVQMVTTVTMGGDFHPGRLADQLMADVSQPEINPVA